MAADPAGSGRLSALAQQLVQLPDEVGLGREAHDPVHALTVTVERQRGHAPDLVLGRELPGAVHVHAVEVDPAFVLLLQLGQDGLEALAGHAAYSDEHPYWAGIQPEAMLIDEVEAIWSAIAERDDWSPLLNKIAAVREMGAALGDPPTPAGHASAD